MQALLGKFGRLSVKNRIRTYQPRDLKLDVSNEAEKHLEDLKFEDVQDVSLGASTFFAWV